MKASAIILLAAGIATGCAEHPAPQQVARKVTFTVTDLGTLQPFLSSKAAGINNLGQVVGRIYTVGAGTHGFLWSKGHMRDLDQTGVVMCAYAINDRGEIVGKAHIPFVRAAGYIMEGGKRTNLVGPACPQCDALAINCTGDIVGKAGPGPQLTSERAVLWHGGRPILLDSVPGGTSVANAINDSGVIVGWAGKTGQDSRHAVIWQGKKMMTLPGASSFLQTGANAINNRGQVAGFLLTRAKVRHACLWSGGKLVDLGSLGGQDSEAQAINAKGDVVGWAEVPNGDRHAFLYRGGKMMDLNTLLPKDNVWVLRNATAVNAKSQIVGSGATNLKVGDSALTFDADGMAGAGSDRFVAFLLNPIPGK